MIGCNTLGIIKVVMSTSTNVPLCESLTLPVTWEKQPGSQRSEASSTLASKTDLTLPRTLKCYTHMQPNFICRALRKHLLSFLVTLVKCLSQYTKGWRLDKERIFIGDLSYALALNLDLADNPQFYDLPVLETSLVCLVHVTAQPHWSFYSKYSQGMSLCLQLMSSLIQASVSSKAIFKSRANEHLLINRR